MNHRDRVVRNDPVKDHERNKGKFILVMRKVKTTRNKNKQRSISLF